MPTIAIIGAGPGLGLAIGRLYGSKGYDVALISRDATKLETLAEQLRNDGVLASRLPGSRAT